MGKSTITKADRLELMALYDQGKRYKAQQLALRLGVSKYYATVLVARRDKPRPSQKKWKRAIENGAVIV
jgi:hypothetical protein